MIPADLRRLIRRMASENPTWGQERIADELLLKLGIRISPRSFANTCPSLSSDDPAAISVGPRSCAITLRPSVACDFFVAVTATFRQIYVFVVTHHSSEELLHFNVTKHPTADWTLQQLRQTFGPDDAFRFLLHDRDSIFSEGLDRSIAAFVCGC